MPLRVIGAGRFELSGVDIESLQWSADTEVADLQGCDIGLVPLLDDPWSPWKFFFKTVQYMAVGLPVVARRMGSNCEVIREGENGFLVETPDEWHDRLHLLVHDNCAASADGSGRAPDGRRALFDPGTDSKACFHFRSSV